MAGLQKRRGRCDRRHVERQGSMRNIFLIGFMGCGKSTVAAELQNLYGMQVCEMDQMIVESAQISILQIFQKYGEEYFRDLETELLVEIGANSNQVVSCGGGIVLRQENISEMKQSGNIVLLTANPETILRRVSGDNNRPILQGKKTVKDISELMEKRREKYEMAADIMIATDDKAIHEICEEIINKLAEIGE